MAVTSTHPGDTVIDVRAVTKTFPGRVGVLGGRRPGVPALRGVDMIVQRGAVFGLLGPNGAGKSTLVKILLTIIRRSGGEGTVLGRAVGDKAALVRIGYLPEHHRFPEYHTAGQVLDYYGALAGVDRATRRARSGELLELVGLRDWGDKKVKGFSKGMRQRLGIANALMNDPDLVVLDEPTDGVDPVGRRDIREILVELRRRGKTVLLNSHLLSELEMVCDRVAIMVQGLVTSQGTIDELTRASRRYEIDVAIPASLGDVRFDRSQSMSEPMFLPPLLAGLATLPPPTTVASLATPPSGGERAMTVRGQLIGQGVALEVHETGRTADGVSSGTITVGTDSAEAVQPLLDVLRARGLVIRAVRPVRHSLEDLFMQAVTDPETGRAMAPGAAMQAGAAAAVSSGANGVRGAGGGR